MKGPLNTTLIVIFVFAFAAAQADWAKPRPVDFGAGQSGFLIKSYELSNEKWFSVLCSEDACRFRTGFPIKEPQELDGRPIMIRVTESGKLSNRFGMLVLKFAGNSGGTYWVKPLPYNGQDWDLIAELVAGNKVEMFVPEKFSDVWDVVPTDGLAERIDAAKYLIDQIEEFEKLQE